MINNAWFRAIRCLLLLGPVLAGCASTTQTILDKENMLSAAGFKVKFAQTPAQRANLQTLPPNQLVARSRGDAVYYLYADPTVCECIYVGNQQAYQQYQKMRFEQNLATEQAMAVQLNQEAAMDWDAWGPVWY